MLPKRKIKKNIIFILMETKIHIYSNKLFNKWKNLINILIYYKIFEFIYKFMKYNK